MNYNFAVIDWKLLNQPFLPCSVSLLSIRGWAVSTATLVCGWTAILARATAEHDQSAPHTAALSSLKRRTSPWTRWKCGRLENLANRRRWETAFFIYQTTQGHEMLWLHAKWTPTAFKLGSIRVCALKIWEFILQMSSKTFASLSTVTQMENFIYIAASLLHCCFLYYMKNETCGILLRFVFQDEEGEGKRSVLDMDPEVQAILEMTGKSLHSQGLREPEEDQDQWGRPNHL